eukprot:CCRYP_010796-RB/>CCRYP_010796-RB protein AED:0.39 eAED:0.39 QI:0/0/0/1/0/0/2/0/319
MYGLPQAGLLTNELLEKGSIPMDTVKAHWSWGYGPTHGDLFSAPSWLMTLASNMSAKNTHNIFLQCYRNTTKSQLIGPAPATLASHLTGTTSNVVSIFPCLATLTKRFANSSMPDQQHRNMHPFSVCPLATMPKRSMPKHPPHLCHSTTEVKNSSNKYTKQLLDYIATQDKAVLTYNASNTWSSPYMVTPATSANWVHVAGPVGTSFSLPMQRSHPTMGHLKHCPHHQTHHGHHHQSQTGSVVHHGQRGCLDLHHPDGNGPHATCHPSPNRQLHSRRRREQKSPTKTNKGHGHAIPLAARSRMPRPIPHLLAHRQAQLC